MSLGGFSILNIISLANLQQDFFKISYIDVYKFKKLNYQKIMHG